MKRSASIIALTLLGLLLAAASAKAQTGTGGSGGTRTGAGCPKASASQSGCLSSSDWTLFNAKGAGTVTSVTFTGDGVLFSSTPSSAVTTFGTLPATLANAPAGMVLNNMSNVAAPPTWTNSAVLGLTGGGGYNGEITLEGVTSGEVSLTTPNIAGASHTIRLPINNGTSGYLLSTDGGSPAQTSWVAPLVSSVFGLTGAIANLSGDVTTSGSAVTTVLKVNGVAYAASPATDTVPVITAANTATAKLVPDCTDTTGNHLNYTQSTHAFSCGTSSAGGGVAWSAITNPTGDLSLTMAHHLTTLTYDATTGAGVNLIDIGDTLNNTGTGAFIYAHTASGSNAIPLETLVNAPPVSTIPNAYFCNAACAIWMKVLTSNVGGTGTPRLVSNGNFSLYVNGDSAGSNAFDQVLGTSTDGHGNVSTTFIQGYPTQINLENRNFYGAPGFGEEALSVQAATTELFGVRSGYTDIRTQPISAEFGSTGAISSFQLVKLANAPSVAARTLTTDTSGVIGIYMDNPFGSTWVVAVAGEAKCVFDGATTAGDYVTISSTTAGDCKDAGSSPPATQVVGRVLSTNVGAGTYLIEMTLGKEANAPIQGTAATPGTDQTATEGDTTIFTTTKEGFYSVNIYVRSSNVCSNATGGGVTVGLKWTDDQGAKSQTSVPLDVNGSATLTGSVPLGDTTSYGSGVFNFEATASTTIQFNTTLSPCTVGTAKYRRDVAVTQLR